MAIEDSSQEVNISSFPLFPSHTSDCDSNDDSDGEDPIELIKDLNTQLTRLHYELVESQKLCEASNRKVNDLKA